jgi:hypothetical protein
MVFVVTTRGSQRRRGDTSAGGEARQILRDSIWLGGNRFNTLAWTPDQKNVIVMRDDDVLWRVPLDGTAPQPMNFLSDGGFWRPEGATTPKVEIAMTGRFKSPAIHPDGKSIAFSLAQTDAGEMWHSTTFCRRDSKRLVCDEIVTFDQGARSLQ